MLATFTVDEPGNRLDLDEFLEIGCLARGGRGLESLDERSELKGQETVFRTGPAQDLQKSLGTNQYRFGLAVNRQDKTCVRVFQGVEHFRKITVKFTTANEASARLRHQIPQGQNRPRTW